MRQSTWSSALRRLGRGALALAILLAAPPLLASPAGETRNESATETGGRWMSGLAQEHEGDEPVASEAATLEPSQPVTAREVDYGAGVSGYVAVPEKAEGSLPGLVVIHEWWGLNDNIRAMTRRLAGEGYRALAVDLYGGEVADTRDGAMQLMRTAMSDQEAAFANLDAAIAWLDDQGSEEVGVIGWCFGGAWSLQSAIRFGDRLDATVIYYGRVTTEAEQLEKIEAPILGIFGGQDQSIPTSSVEAFAAALAEAGGQVTIEIYPDADHAFANPSGTNYEPRAAEDAWRKTVAFLEQQLD